MDKDSISWKLIDKYFNDNPHNLVAHHLESYNSFFSEGINRIFKENNPIRFIEREDEDNQGKVNQCSLYLGGKDGSKLYYGKPVIYDDNYSHYMYPNDARLRNMTYGITIHYDVDVEFTFFDDQGEKKEHTITLEKILLGRFPIMLQSNLCILNGLARDVRFNMGECKNDYGGYFIIDGKEKVIVSQEKFADNILYIRKNKADDTYSFSAEVRSVSEDASKPIRTTAVKIVAPSTVLSNNQIVVLIPNVRKPIPLFILMRALGVVSDQQIIEYCLLADLTENKNQNSYVDLFIPSIHDANKIFNQETALKFIASFTKRGTIDSVLDILMNYFLPHIGEQNFLDKAYFIGYMVKRLLRVFTGEEKPTDRDNFKYKRVELAGSLIYDLFREYYLIQKREIGLKIDKEFYYHSGKYKNKFIDLVSENYPEYFKERTVDKGFKKAFKGNWGAEAHTKRVGVIQDVNRLSWNSFISQMRKFNLPLDASAKVVGPRLLHSSQWGYIDPVDTPDGGNIGLHKHMAISTAVTSGFSVKQIIPWLRLHINLKLLQECTPVMLSIFTKVFVNGVWIGSIEEPMKIIKYLKLLRRNGLLPIFMSISFNYESNEISIFTDAGRLTRPVYYIEEGKPSYQRKEIMDLIKMGKFTWEQAVGGFEEKDDKMFSIKSNTIYELDELYPKISKDNLETELKSKSAVVEYLDTAEEEGTLMATSVDDLKKSKYYTHLEVDPSLILGVLGNFIIFPENNPYPRDAFSCGQTKQAVSLYHSNYQMRIDKMGVVLNSGQIPLIKSRYMDYINKEEQPYGVNAVVAIMSYTGYNVEDAILINEGAIQRGIFRTTYYSMYEAREESSKVQGTTSNSYFSDVMSKNVVGLKPGCDYSQLDKWGLIRENTQVDDKMVVIGKVTSNAMDSEVVVDSSIFPKKGQLGFVDKSFITEGEEGFRIAKVRIREERVPAIGDKMASRAGQKGTLGLIIPEQDMPFTADGIRPDLIINPHAIPSRMTIGQLIESLLGKACCVYGGFGDCTAFANKGPNADVYGHMLVKAGFNASGNQILYNGMTGEQLYSDIYIGPTYYMRLKHMVKDKINYRALGPRTMLTRQTVQGRANDGGLRIGEMERDGVMAHGASAFLNESFMIRGDEYYMAVCNKTGAVAIYNQNLNLFLSPFSDGPINFNTTLDGKMNIRNISRFGRSFSIVRIPYALKLLIQELQVMNVQMRIITEDNIDQLINMSYSNNINELLKSKENLEELANSYKGMIMGKKRELYSKPVTKNIPKEAPEYPEIKMEETPEFKPVITPSFSPESPPFAPDSQPNTDSPPFAPDSQPNTASPPFASASPAYNPMSDSPPFVLGSPVYNPNTPSSPPYAPESPSIQPQIQPQTPSSFSPPLAPQVGGQPVNITLSIDEVSKLKEMIDEKKEKEFEPIIFETKPKEPPKSIFDVEEDVKVDEDTTSSSTSNDTSDTSSSSSGAKKVIIL
uniref:DNA-directed RNA polymerase n=1 Tax=viral metagenome TaxID=1070528 RepID=A0A6C0CYJ5_9ZZZZ